MLGAWSSSCVTHFLLSPQSTTLKKAGGVLRITFDHDGVVVELKELCNIKVALSRICLGFFSQGRLHHFWHTVKKHLDLKKVSSKGMKILKKIRGATIVHFDGSYTLDLVVMPLRLSSAHPLTETLEDSLPRLSLEQLNEVLRKFVDLLHGLSPEEMARDTLKKAVLINKGWMNVLPKDQEFILSLLDKAMAAVKHDNLCIQPFFHRFGQKSNEIFDIEEICPFLNVKRISLHVALNLLCSQWT